MGWHAERTLVISTEADVSGHQGSPRCRGDATAASAFLTLLWCLVVNELSWHVSEPGKTVGVVFFAAVLLQ